MLSLGLGGTLELSARRGRFPCCVVPGQFHKCSEGRPTVDDSWRQTHSDTSRLATGTPTLSPPSSPSSSRQNRRPLLGQTCSLCEANTFLESKSASACLSSRDKEGGVLRSTAGVSGLPGRISRMGGCPPRFELNFFFQTPRGVNQLHPLLTDVPEVACEGRSECDSFILN